MSEQNPYKSSEYQPDASPWDDIDETVTLDPDMPNPFDPANNADKGDGKTLWERHSAENAEAIDSAQ